MGTQELPERDWQGVLLSTGPWRFQIAHQPEILEQVARLNHLTFAEEIPQHQARPDGRLIDARIAQSTPLVCLDHDGVLRGMLCVSDQRPFSLDEKLGGVDAYLPPHRSPCEFRLLAVDREKRGLPILACMIGLMVELCHQRGYDLGLISATTRQLKLYRHMGFREFAQPVGSADALYQPMYLTWDRVPEWLGEYLKREIPDGKSVK